MRKISIAEIVTVTRFVIIFRNPHCRLFGTRPSRARARTNSKWRQYVIASLNRYYYMKNLFRVVVRFRQSQSSISLSPFDSLKWILRDYMLHRTASDTAHYYDLRASLFRLDVNSYFLLSVNSDPSTALFTSSANFEWRIIYFWRQRLYYLRKENLMTCEVNLSINNEIWCKGIFSFGYN